MTTLNIVEASIEDLQSALASGSITSVDLIARYLRRIARYDLRGPSLNAIPILNMQVFDDAAASDDARATGNPVLPLEGLPFTVKDSYKVQGMTVASGSPAFADLIANSDAFTVKAIRGAGGIVLGRTNMPPMAYGGMQRGVYGRAESPYNPKYLAAAFASGSSNGSAVSTASSMAAFGMAEETVSSGRSPASNNALVAYTPSRGWISIRGNWPLYPTCDVIVPHARTMGDLLALLPVITADDETTEGDFWRDQPFVELEKPWGGKNTSPGYFADMGNTRSLQGLRIAVPSMYTGGAAPNGATPVAVNKEVVELWRAAKNSLETLGAQVIETPDFPVVTAYEHPDVFLSKDSSARLPDDWHWYERGPMIAHGWDRFLRNNADPTCPNLSAVKDELAIFPLSMRGPAEKKHLPSENAVHWGKLAGYVEAQPEMYKISKLEDAVKSLEAMRKAFLDEYLQENDCHLVVFPACGDVGEADTDVNFTSAAHSWQNGVYYSNGNRALRHMGIPSVTVPMGVMPEKKMPIGLTFLGRAYDDENLLRWANAFEKATGLRTSPGHTPALESDIIQLADKVELSPKVPRPTLTIDSCSAMEDGEACGMIKVEVRGRVEPVVNAGDAQPLVQVTVDGKDIPADQISIEAESAADTCRAFQFWASTVTPKPVVRQGWEKTAVSVAGDKTMVVVLARSSARGFPAGYLELL